jgi:hypothetical protein
MRTGEIFVTCMITLILFNFFYYAITGRNWQIDIIGGVAGFLTLVAGVSIIAGIQFVGSGVNTEGIKILFGFGCLLNLLFQIKVGHGFPMGFGLLTNVFDAFTSSSDFLGFGVFITSVLGLTIIISGLLVIVGGSGA